MDSPPISLSLPMTNWRKSSSVLKFHSVRRVRSGSFAPAIVSTTPRASEGREYASPTAELTFHGAILKDLHRTVDVLAKARHA